MRRPWIGTNWKMHKTLAEARAFAEAVAASELARSEALQLFVIPPFTALAAVAEILGPTNVIVGAQNIHWEDFGPFTGEISPVMARDAGAGLAEIGHSERRQHFGETDAGVARKTAAALRHGLVALVCVGDSRAEFEAGRSGEAVARQVEIALGAVRPEQAARVVIAYEPVWSIGEGGTPADPSFANEQHRLIKEVAQRCLGQALDVVYGGSVNPGNAVTLAAQPHVDGLFIGRSAWSAEGLLGIAEAVIRDRAARTADRHGP
jgi:triosephosphate isomerase